MTPAEEADWLEAVQDGSLWPYKRKEAIASLALSEKGVSLPHPLATEGSPSLTEDLGGDATKEGPGVLNNARA